jgi:hypothetical protein
VITRLGELADVNPRVVEGLFAGDLAYLESLYRRINENGNASVTVTCPHCGGTLEVETSVPGG